jgi:hypothetical protein
MGLRSIGKLLAFPTNVRLGWKWNAVANTVAYYVMATFTAVRILIVQAAEEQ